MLETNRKIAYFAGCTVNYIEPGLGKAVVEVLQKNGFRPVLPDQKCCAVPQLFYGKRKSFLKHAEFNVHSLAEADCDIVTACTSCALAIKCDYPKFLKGQEAEKVSQRMFDIMEYLVMLKERNALNTDFHPVNLNLLYHAPCHLKALGHGLIWSRLELIRLIPRISISLIDRGCCGMGGTFGMKQRNYAKSMKIGRSLFDGIKQLSPDMVVTECPGCKMQIEQGSGVTAIHPVFIIKQAYRL